MAWGSLRDKQQCNLNAQQRHTITNTTHADILYALFRMHSIWFVCSDSVINIWYVYVASAQCRMIFFYKIRAAVDLRKCRRHYCIFHIHAYAVCKYVTLTFNNVSIELCVCYEHVVQWMTRKLLEIQSDHLDKHILKNPILIRFQPCWKQNHLNQPTVCWLVCLLAGFRWVSTSLRAQTNMRCLNAFSIFF